jgi:serine O-acetyltransferase
MGLARVRPGEGATPENAPVIGDRVDIGAGAVIIGAVQIGDDVSIFPNAVVMTNIPSNSVVMTAMSKIMKRT